MQKKKILIFIDWFLPGYKAGGPVRSMANMVEYLKDEYEFFIITRNTDYTETRPYESVKSNCWENFSENVKVYYADIKHQNKAAFKQVIKEIRPDIVYVNGVYSWKFSILPLIVARTFKEIKLIVASRGMLAMSAIDVKGGKKRFFLKLAKMIGLYKNVLFHATNEKEVQDIHKALGNTSKVIVADNLPKKCLPETKNIIKNRGELKLVSLARIAPEKNTLFALEKLLELSFDNLEDPSTSLREQLGVQVENCDWNIVFDLYGQIYNVEYWLACQKVIAQLPENISVNYKGTVDADLVGETIQYYHGLFMPTRGENFGHVILESLSAGRPVLISDQTPWRNLVEKKSGFDLDLNRSTDYKSALAQLLKMDQEEFDLWCEGARTRAEGFVNNPELKSAYDRMFLI